jgi:RES domain-containing protein
MQLFRIAKAKYIRDLSGEGAYLYGGRWNSPGTRMLYTASNRALAQIETLVHVSLANLPKDLHIATLSLPDRYIQALDPKRWPSNWDSIVPQQKSQILGDEWIESGLSLAMAVPSAAVKGESNVLINPRHRHIGKLKIEQVEALEYDERIQDFLKAAAASRRKHN